MRITFFTPRRLLRLYPGLFRLRYGAEFVALLEQGPITRAVVVDTVRSAAWEWLRWSRIGRVVLALLVALPLPWIASWFNRAWPFPSGFWNHTPTWSHFSEEMLVLFAPGLVATFLVMVARPLSDPRRHIGFAAQVLTLAICAIAGQWMGVSSVPGPAASYLHNWLGSGFFIAPFLVWIFNIERGGIARYTRRLRFTGLDHDR